MCLILWTVCLRKHLFLVSEAQLHKMQLLFGKRSEFRGQTLYPKRDSTGIIRNHRDSIRINNYKLRSVLSNYPIVLCLRNSLASATSVLRVLRPGKVDYGLSVRVWVGFEPKLGSKKNLAKIFKSGIFIAFYRLNLPLINANASTGYS